MGEVHNAHPADEAARLRADAKMRMDALKRLWATFAITGVILLAFLAVALRLGLSWFVSNTKVDASPASIGVAANREFQLATVGTKSQGVYDTKFDLVPGRAETIGDSTYYIAEVNTSFGVSSTKNINNYLANADLRPGNRGTFDLYVICRTSNRQLTLQPVFEMYYDEPVSEGSDPITRNVRDIPDTDDRKAEIQKAAVFLEGHLLLFAEMDARGMYSNNLDFTKEIVLDLDSKTDTVTNNGRSFSWGEEVYSDGETAVYRLPVYWVWPSQFGNFIYTGNSYNSNLFADRSIPDYSLFSQKMEGNQVWKKFFDADENAVRPPLSTIITPTNHSEATKNYELYSHWYNLADECIGQNITYIELGFQLV